jgi:hypothetical protein
MSGHEVRATLAWTREPRARWAHAGKTGVIDS